MHRTPCVAAALLLTLPLTALANVFGQPDATAAQLNEALGIDLFADKPLWEEDEAVVAERLTWPEESRTTELASYRRYALQRVMAPEDEAAQAMTPTAAGEDAPPEEPSEKPANESAEDPEETPTTKPEEEKPELAPTYAFKPIQVGGRDVYSAALYATDGKPEMISIVFSNKGDFDDLDTLREGMEEDETTLETKLTKLLGEGKRDSFGKREFRERVTRWDWNGSALLLGTQEDNYVLLRIVPEDVADNEGVGEVLNDREMKRVLEERVERRPNGDVVVTEIPMVDQGPKGYCVPATWERYLRYLKIPADMYVLSMAGNTQFGGGTLRGALDESVDNLAQRYKRRVTDLRRDLSLREVKRHIDKGLPLIWTCRMDPLWDEGISGRAVKRAEMTDMKEWRDMLVPFRQNARKAAGAYGHMRMIIGYNEKTGELAISDSWGQKTAERWITEEEALAMTEGELTIIKY